jgi:hypothetical protein
MRIIILTFIIGAFFSCSSGQITRYDGQLTQPKDATVLLQGLCYDQFTADKAMSLKRYFSGNPRWEVLQEGDKVYAIRKEKQDEKYLTSLNGFYSNFEDTIGPLQTRVIVSFGKYYGFGNDESGITFADSQDKTVGVTIEGEHEGEPGNSSYLIIKSKNINVEIFEQAKNINRNFTQQAITEINKELSDVLKYENELTDNGVIPVAGYYPFKLDSAFFHIFDGMQPGIYVIQAAVKPDRQGIIYAKVFNVKTNQQLSADRITPTTKREIGWSKTGQTYFQYESELTVYEGDWDHQYQARFEIWFRDKNGQERKLAEQIKLINGWER